MSLAPGPENRQILADAVRQSLRGVIDPELGENLMVKLQVSLAKGFFICNI